MEIAQVRAAMGGILDHLRGEFGNARSVTRCNAL
jgi:hypothetical protein